MLFRYSNHRSQEGKFTALEDLPSIVAGLGSVDPAHLKARLNEPGFNGCVVTPFEGGSPNRRVSASNPAVLMHGLVLDFDFKSIPSMVSVTTPEFVRTLNRRHTKSPDLVPSLVSRTSGGGVRLFYRFERPLPIDFDGKVFGNFVTALVRKVVGAGEKCSIPGLDLPLITRTNQLYDAGTGFVATPAKHVGSGLLESLVHDALTKPERERDETPIPPEVLQQWHAEVFADCGVDWTRFSTSGWRPGKRYWEGADEEASDSVLVYPDGVFCYRSGGGFFPWRKIFVDGRVDRYTADVIADATRDIYFAGASKFYVPDRGNWLGVAEPTVRRRLQASGLSNEGGVESEINRAVGQVETNNTVAGCFPFLYNPDPVVRFQGSRYLNVAKSGAMQPHPTAAGWGESFPKLATFFDGFFLGDEERQKAYYLAWLQRSYAAALAGKPLRGQAVFLAGGRSSGKNFSTEGINSPLLGGHANGEEFLTGRDGFSANVFNRGLVLLNDPEPPVTRTEKKKFTAMLKKHVANETITYRAMYSDPVTLPWQGRFVITINDNPAALESLPEVSSDVIDKLMFFRVQPVAEWKGKTYPSNEDLGGELPHFAAWLLAWEPDTNIVKFNARFGVESYHHPDIMSEASSLSFGSQVVSYVHDYLQSTEQRGPRTYLLSELFEIIAESSRAFQSLCRTRKALDQSLSEAAQNPTVHWVRRRSSTQNRVAWTFDFSPVV